MSQYILKLFIAGHTEQSDRAVANIRKVFDQFGENYQLMIVDILENPEYAEINQVLATPTLIRLEPQPPLRMIGDFSDIDRVRGGLGLQ